MSDLKNKKKGDLENFNQEIDLVQPLFEMLE